MAAAPAAVAAARVAVAAREAVAVVPAVDAAPAAAADRTRRKARSSSLLVDRELFSIELIYLFRNEPHRVIA